MTGYYLDDKGNTLRVIYVTKMGRKVLEIGKIGGLGQNNLFLEVKEDQIKKAIASGKLKKK